jgi:2,4-dienoyl-CoA reductase-like NADH-dependent reductase (Old Yellow Enzyme family)
MTKLFSPIKIRDLEIKNRLWVSPMCMYSCEGQDGIVGQWHLVHLGSRAMGGAGMVIAEASAVSPEGRISPWCPGLYADNQIAPWKVITDFIREQGATSGIQLAHAGRKGSTHRPTSGSGSVAASDGGWETYSATSEAFQGLDAPRMLSIGEIPRIVADFSSAALRAQKAGFDSIEIHAAHGYLLHQFLSPISNKRDDLYGGPLENRARLLLEIVAQVRKAVGEQMPVFIRFSSTDYVEGGWDQDQTNQVAKWCRELGADLFDLSSGGLITGVKIPTGPGYQVEFAESAKRATGSDVAAVGQITNAAQAEQVLSEGLVDVVLVGREFLRDPYFGLRAAAELSADIQWPHQYERGRWPNA